MAQVGQHVTAVRPDVCNLPESARRCQGLPDVGHLQLQLLCMCCGGHWSLPCTDTVTGLSERYLTKPILLCAAAPNTKTQQELWKAVAPGNGASSDIATFNQQASALQKRLNSQSGGNIQLVIANAIWTKNLAVRKTFADEMKASFNVSRARLMWECKMGPNMSKGAFRGVLEGSQVGRESPCTQRAFCTAFCTGWGAPPGLQQAHRLCPDVTHATLRCAPFSALCCATPYAG